MTIVDALIGVSAAFAPHAFYRHVLGVDLLGPYDAHLVTDVGGLYLGLAVAVAWAAWTLRPELIAGVCAGALLTQVLHFVFHATHLKAFSTPQAVVQAVLLAVQLLLPAVALGLNARHGRSRAPA